MLTLRIFAALAKATFCSTFFTESESKGSFGPNHRCVQLFPDAGMFCALDAVDGKIPFLEILDRRDTREESK